MRPFLSLPEEETMTLQIGLEASDGFVVASDRRSFSGQIFRSTDMRKILVSDENPQVVCAFSGSDASRRVAQALVDRHRNLKDDSDATKHFIEESVKAARDGQGGEDLEKQLVLAALVNPSEGAGRFWRITFGRTPMALPLRYKIYGGEESNPAVYFPEAHYRESACVEDLELLAAHYILQGAKHSSSVRGLDIYVAKNGSPARFLSKSELAQLSKRSAAIARNLDELLYSHKEPIQ